MRFQLIDETVKLSVSALIVVLVGVAVFYFLLQLSFRNCLHEISNRFAALEDNLFRLDLIEFHVVLQSFLIRAIPHEGEISSGYVVSVWIHTIVCAYKGCLDAIHILHPANAQNLSLETLESIFQNVVPQKTTSRIDSLVLVASHIQ